MRVLVCGGRNYNDKDNVFLTLTSIDFSDGIDLIISGEAKGADTLAKEWALENDVPYKGFPADWDKIGRKAGLLRNQQMLDEGKPDLVVAFPGGSGTAHMVSIAKKKKVEVYIDSGSI